MKVVIDTERQGTRRRHQLEGTEDDLRMLLFFLLNSFTHNKNSTYIYNIYLKQNVRLKNLTQQ